MGRSGVVLVAVAALALGGCGSEETLSAFPDVETQLELVEGAPAPLAGLHTQANELLGGGAEGFRKRLARLKGYPVVVNKWASWCPPCRQEFPFFQRQSVERGKQVAFLGVDSNDNDDDARGFLEEFPLVYPTYKDPTVAVARVFKATLAWPSTAFYDSEGKLAYLKQGGYKKEEHLAADIERYAR